MTNEAAAAAAASPGAGSEHDSGGASAWLLAAAARTISPCSEVGGRAAAAAGREEEGSAGVANAGRLAGFDERPVAPAGLDAKRAGRHSGMGVWPNPPTDETVIRPYRQSLAKWVANLPSLGCGPSERKKMKPCYLR